MPSSIPQTALLPLPAGVTRGHVADARPRPLPTGNAALDVLLGGGVPRGRMTEIYGPPSSGRTSLLHGVLASASAAGEVVALVDPGDGFDPRGAAAAGILLERVLWVRPERPETALRAAEVLLGTRGFGLVALDLPAGVSRELGARAWSRLAQRAAGASGAFLVFSRERAAGGAAALCLSLRRRRICWRGPRRATLFAGIDSEIEIVRSREGTAGRRIRIGACGDAADLR